MRPSRDVRGLQVREEYLDRRLTTGRERRSTGAARTTRGPAQVHRARSCAVEWCVTAVCSTWEAERHAERRAQEAIVLEVEALARILVDERAEIPHVASQPHAIFERVHHAAAEVECEVVLIGVHHCVRRIRDP